MWTERSHWVKVDKFEVRPGHLDGIKAGKWEVGSEHSARFKWSLGRSGLEIILRSELAGNVQVGA